MITVITSIVLPLLTKYLGGLVTGSGALLAAVVGAIPSLFATLCNFVLECCKYPLSAFLLACAIAFPSGFIYGLTWDSSIRAGIERRAIDGANKRADVVIAQFKAREDALKAEIAKLKPKSKQASR